MKVLYQLKKLLEYRELLFELVKRRIITRYKQSILGPAWAILQPLVLMVMFTMIRFFVGISSDGIPYPIFVYSALLPWSFFANSVSFATPSIVQNAGIIRKIYFPRELFQIAAVLTSLFDFLIASIIYCALMVYYKISVSFWILLLPVLLLIQILLALGISFVTAAMSVFRRDLIHGVPLVMQFWMFACPVVYPLSAVPDKYRSIYLLNPMAGIINCYRAVLVKGSQPDLSLLCYGSIAAIVVFLIGYYYFKRLEMRFADIV